ncbi:MAG: phosphatase PAP2 family protein [Calditrichia bacterium]
MSGKRSVRATNIFLICLLFAVPNFAGARQNSDTQSTSQSGSGQSVLLQDARDFVNAGVGLVKAPLQFQGEEWVRFNYIVGTTALLFLLDGVIKDFARDNQNDLNDHIFGIDKYYGNKYGLGISAGLYGFGYAFKNEKIRHMGLYSIEAFLYSGAFTNILKFAIGRRRPYGGDDNLFFKPFRFSNMYKSLPSGHATVAFAVSTVMAKSLDNILWKAAWYGAAGLTGCARIYHNAHWTSDVFLGAAIGYGMASLIVKIHKNEKSKKATFFSAQIRPYLGFNQIGVQLIL